MSTPSAGAERKTDALSRLKIQRSETPHTRRPRFRWLWRTLIFFVVIAVIGAGGVGLASRYGWISAEDNNWFKVPDIIQTKPEVRLATLNAESGRSADATVVATGYLESRKKAKVGARAPGRIEKMNVEEGTKVEANEELAVLEHADLDASLAALDASLSRARAQIAEQEILIEKAKLEYERNEKLRETGGNTEQDYEVAKFAYQGAVAKRASLLAEVELAEARKREGDQMRKNMYIYAPFKGTVISKDAEVGESILPGGMGEASGRGSVVTVADLEHLEVDCDVKEDYISRVLPGQMAEVAVDAVPAKRYQGRVRKVVPMGDRARATIKVKVEIVDVDARLFPDMSATVYFLPEATETEAEPQKKRVFCESEAIKKDDAGNFVWMVDDEDRVKRQNVKTGPVRDNTTEILEGLKGNERVIVAPPGIKSGQLVKVGS